MGAPAHPSLQFHSSWAILQEKVGEKNKVKEGEPYWFLHAALKSVVLVLYKHGTRETQMGSS